MGKRRERDLEPYQQCVLCRDIVEQLGNFYPDLVYQERNGYPYIELEEGSYSGMNAVIVLQNLLEEYEYYKGRE